MKWHKEESYPVGMTLKSGVVAAVCLLFLVAVIGYNRGGDVTHVRVKEEVSKQFSEEDIKAAREVVYEYFKKEFKGCALKEIQYVGDEANKQYKEWGVGNGEEDILVFLSTFKVGFSGADGSLTENAIYEDWEWIVARDKEGNWKHIDHGY